MSEPKKKIHEIILVPGDVKHTDNYWILKNIKKSCGIGCFILYWILKNIKKKSCGIGCFILYWILKNIKKNLVVLAVLSCIGYWKTFKKSCGIGCFILYWILKNIKKKNLVVLAVLSC